MAAAARAAAGFGFDDVAALAQSSAAKPWQPGETMLPPALAGLDYDGQRDIRFRPDQATWRDAALPFRLQFFHRNRFHSEAVEINEISADGVRALPYRESDFDFGQHPLDTRAWPLLGPAGFRVHFALNDAAYLDELIVFLGASYFRALGRGQQYGLSARGLAIDTVGGSAGEEFPRFTRFWIERPAPAAKSLTVYALLDSKSASGAYRFVVVPGDDTVVEVRLRLFLRAPVSELGIAPLTSMFLHGANQPSATDFRPAVHDSDGLMVAAGDGSGATEWLWRPLVNPGAAVASSLGVTRLQGFGLMQRERRFAGYEDTEARYERRPSAWVEPIGDWGPGRVLLLQLHAHDETDDNIVAAWVPAQMPAPGEPLELAYRLHWQGDTQQRPPGGWTLQTRRGQGWAPLAPGELQFVVDFDGPALRALAPGATVDAVASAPANGRITDARSWPRPDGSWRLQLRVQRLDPRQPIELRAFLRHADAALTETWAALIPQDPKD